MGDGEIAKVAANMPEKIRRLFEETEQAVQEIFLTVALGFLG
jgi:hypothetical protein